jgi:hypothetical protein
MPEAFDLVHELGPQPGGAQFADDLAVFVAHLLKDETGRWW